MKRALLYIAAGILAGIIGILLIPAVIIGFLIYMIWQLEEKIIEEIKEGNVKLGINRP